MCASEYECVLLSLCVCLCVCGALALADWLPCGKGSDIIRPQDGGPAESSKPCLVRQEPIRELDRGSSAESDSRGQQQLEKRPVPSQYSAFCTAYWSDMRPDQWGSFPALSVPCILQSGGVCESVSMTLTELSAFMKEQEQRAEPEREGEPASSLCPLLSLIYRKLLWIQASATLL